MNLIVDINNIVSTIRHGKLGRPKSRSQKEKKATETLFLLSLRSIITTMRVTKCTSVVAVKDSRGLWRREIYPLYKVTDAVDKAEDHYTENVIEAANMLFSFFEECTSAYALAYNRAEADDIIGSWCRYSNADNTIMSSDKDYVQLINDHTKLYYPSGKVYRETDDPKYDLFLKCVRGDKSDKIRSVWSGIRETKLKLAWENPIEMANLMESTTPTGEKFKDIYALNRSVIALCEIPEPLETGILETILDYVPSKFTELSATKWVYDRLGIEIPEIPTGAAYFRNIPVFRDDL